MNNLSPILRDLRPLHHVIPSNIDLGEQWEIMDIYDEDIIWNIAMSYLNYFPRNDDNSEMKRRLNTLGVKSIDKNLDDSVKKYNPFLQRNTYFCQKIMDCVVKSFKEAIKKFVCNYQEFDYLPSFNECLENCSILLSCSILVVTIKTGDKIDSIELYPHVRNEDWPPDIKVLTIFKTLNCKNSTGGEELQETFSFGMSKEYGLIKQRIAMREILKSTTYENETAENVMKKVLRCPGVQEHFLCALLRNNLGIYVKDIYKSSYVLTKLRDAGLQTDPRTKDNQGNIALYYALCGTDISLLYFLYDYAANACFMENCSVRHPNKSIIKSMRVLKYYLKELKNKTESGIDHVNYKRKLEEILKLNSFQIEVCSNINEINEKYEALLQNKDDEGNDEYGGSNRKEEKCDDNNKPSRHSEKNRRILEAKQRKEVISSILETYQKYFFWSHETAVIYNLLMHLKEFSDHNSYFENLDFCSTVMFFDKLFLLKERVKLPFELYTQIESKFFFLIYSWKYLLENKKPSVISATEVTRMVPLQVRLSLEKSICCFKEELTRFPITETNTLKRVPNNAVETLTNLSLFYDEFLIRRIKHYLDIAINIKIKDKEFKSILIIERALQVIGECLTITERGFKSVQKIFPLILPQNLKQYLVNIRNKLCHFTSDETEYRKTAETDINMFIEIQTELKNFKNILMPVIFNAHAYAMERFILTFFYNIIEKASQGSTSDSSSEENQKSFKKILLSLESQILDVDDANKYKLKELRRYFKYPIEYLFQSIRNEMKEMNLKRNFTEIKQEINDYIWTVEFILQYICTDEGVREYRDTLSQKISERKILFADCESKQQIMKDSFYYDNIDMNSVLFYGNMFKKNTIINKGAEKNECNENMSNVSVSSNVNSQKLLKNTSLHDASYCSKFDIINDVSILTKKFEEILADYERFSKEMLENVQPEESELVFSFKNLAKLRHILYGKPLLNAEERQVLLKLKKRSEDILFAKDRIKSFLDGSKMLTEEELKAEVSLLPLGKKKKEELIRKHESDPSAYLSMIETVPCYVDIIDDVIQNLQINSKTCQELCKKLEAPSEAIAVLKKLTVGQNRSTSGSLVKFLKDRIAMLKVILIDQNNDIKRLWEKAKSEKTKNYLHERIIELYLTNNEVQASIEMLLMNCMAILNDEKFESLLRKATNLFSGINLKNVLAHGNPLLETVGRLVDPTDLPSELLQKMMVLIYDDHTLDCMVKLLNILKSDFDYFINVMENKSHENMCPDVKKLCEEIKKCKHWKGYAKILKQDNF